LFIDGGKPLEWNPHRYNGQSYLVRYNLHLTILIAEVDSTLRFDRIIRALIKLGSEVHLGNQRRQSEWPVTEELLEIVELANDVLVLRTEIGCIDWRYHCKQRNVIVGVTIFHVKGRCVKDLTIEDVVGKVHHTFHLLEERKAEDDVDCDIRPGCNTEGALVAVFCLVGKMELECSIESCRDRMGLV
jgi:hypothetical protein